MPKTAVLLLAPLILALPFLTQAFHIDDRIYLEIAENIERMPLHPYDYAPLFEGLETPDAASHSHLPLVSYYLAMVRQLTGRDTEWVFHAAFLVFPLILSVSFFDLARRSVRFPLAATLILLLTPGVFVLSHTLMTEIALLAFWVLAVSRFLRILEGSRKIRDWWICGAALLAAAFTSLLTLGLLVLLLALVIFDRQVRRAGDSTGRIHWIGVVFLIGLPLLLWSGWYFRAYLHYDRFVLLRTLEHMDKREAFSGALLLSKLESFILNLGAVSVFPAAFWLGIAGRRLVRTALGIGLLGFLGTWVVFPEWSVLHRLFFSAFLATGLLGLSVFFDRTVKGAGVRGQSDGRDLPDRILFWLFLSWFSGILACYVLLYPSGSVRYFLLAMPPLVLVWMRCLQEKIENGYLLRNVVGLILCLNLLYSGLIGATDYQFAGMYRRAARELVSEYAQRGRTVWFTAEWGFRYYLEREGARYLLRTSVEPREGDLILKPYVASKWVTLYDDPRFVKLLEQRPLSYTSPVRLLDFASQAGFYSSAWGLLPVSWSTTDQMWEWVNVFEVVRQYDGPVPEAERHW